MSARNQISGTLGDIARAEQLEFSFNASANDGDVIDRRVPFDGKVVEMLYGAPAAANNKVGVQVSYDGDQKFPGDRESDFIALADVVHPFLLVFDVEEGDEINVAYENTDSKPHYLNVVLTVAQFKSDQQQG